MSKTKYIETYKHKNVKDADNTLNNILDLIVEGTWDWDAKTGHVDRSPGWYRMLGYEVGVFQKDVFTWENIIHPDDHQRVMNTFELCTTGKSDSYSMEYRCLKADGTYLWIMDRGKVLERDPSGKVLRMIGAHQNIHEEKLARTELVNQNRLLQKGNVTLGNIIREKANELEKKNKELQEKMVEVEHVSNTDSLTNIPNRKKFEEMLEKEILRSNRYNHALSLVIFDIDLFKRVNDTYGHRAGDLVLKTIAELVSSNIRKIDFVARWGGDEFVLILPGLVAKNALLTIKKLKALISEHEIKPGIFVNCSFGMAQYVTGDTIEDLFFRADDALYQSKKTGRNKAAGL